jgi:hypothetical protein
MDSLCTLPPTQPVLIRRNCGGWLAVSPLEATLKIGVIAPTEDEARELFRKSVERWAQLLAEPAN